MPVQTGHTLSELDEALKDYLLITDNDAGHWTAADRYKLLNQAQAWVQRKALVSHYERRTNFHFFSMDGTSGETLLPNTIIVETTLYKKNPSKTGDAQWEQIRLIRAEEEANWQNTGSEEVWVSDRQRLRAKGASYPTGDYRLQHIERVPDMVATTDVCQLHPDLHEFVVLRAGQRAAESTNDQALATRAINELADWVEQLKDHATLFAQLRGGSTTPRLSADFTDGSLFRLMERLRVRFGAVVAGDKLTRDLLKVMLNEATQRVALTVKSVFETHLEKTWYFEMTGQSNEILLPRDFKSHIMLQHRSAASTGELGWTEVPIVRSIDQDQTTYAFQPQVADPPLSASPSAAIITGRNIRFITSSPPSGQYRLLYIQLIVPMEADEDECSLDADYHQAVIVEASKDLAAMFGLQSQQSYFDQQAAEWHNRLIADASRRSYRTVTTIQDTMGWSDEGDGMALPYGV